ncbi:Uncharacterised protein [uncultured archaeon]|nr:Uncharacterised protein [uncultured archaeon]
MEQLLIRQSQTVRLQPGAKRRPKPARRRPKRKHILLPRKRRLLPARLQMREQPQLRLLQRQSRNQHHKPNTIQPQRHSRRNPQLQHTIQRRIPAKKRNTTDVAALRSNMSKHNSHKHTPRNRRQQNIQLHIHSTLRRKLHIPPHIHGQIRRNTIRRTKPPHHRRIKQPRNKPADNKHHTLQLPLLQPEHSNRSEHIRRPRRHLQRTSRNTHPKQHNPNTNVQRQLHASNDQRTNPAHYRPIKPFRLAPSLLTKLHGADTQRILRPSKS